MNSSILNQIVVTLVTTAVLCLGFAQPSAAGVVTTEQLIQAETRANTLSRIETTLLREDVAAQLVKHGVEPSAVLARVSNMTTNELIALDGQINEQIAGADVVGIVGAVFIVLLILELVGVTDIFKSF